ncbi:hypothetical protein ACTWQB_15690 [Piscibacillus sp. B03]|uniref:hypothetical protein n=1 Tax=Piscibacillus sp. B03 TaxID=3457430 RepID=UPI003FCDFCDA
MMTAYEVIQKQEEYRERTIQECIRMLEIGYSKQRIAEELGVPNVEATAIIKIAKRRMDSVKANKKPIERRWF